MTKTSNVLDKIYDLAYGNDPGIVMYEEGKKTLRKRLEKIKGLVRRHRQDAYLSDLTADAMRDGPFKTVRFLDIEDDDLAVSGAFYCGAPSPHNDDVAPDNASPVSEAMIAAAFSALPSDAFGSITQGEMERMLIAALKASSAPPTFHQQMLDDVTNALGVLLESKETAMRTAEILDNAISYAKSKFDAAQPYVKRS